MNETGIKSFRNLKPHDLVNLLATFIERELSGFPKSEEFKQLLSERKNENLYTVALILYFINKKESIFNFINENPQESSNTVDVGVYRGAKLFYTIEAKVLPTPLSGGRKEYEYVYGKGGGIQRFKDRKHGVDHNGNIMPNSGMIGYVEGEGYSHWLKLINKWIDDAQWGGNEHLKNIKIAVSARLNSKHKTKNDSIELDHFWIKV